MGVQLHLVDGLFHSLFDYHFMRFYHRSCVLAEARERRVEVSTLTERRVEKTERRVSWHSKKSLKRQKGQLVFDQPTLYHSLSQHSTIRVAQLRAMPSAGGGLYYINQ
jgi:hypothetical protein